MVVFVRIPNCTHPENNLPWPEKGWYNKYEWMVLLSCYKDFCPRPARWEFDFGVPRHAKHWYSTRVRSTSGLFNRFRAYLRACLVLFRGIVENADAF